MNSETIRVPVVARMAKNPDTGEYEIVPEKSIYADIPADAVARFIMKGMHVDFGKQPSGAVKQCD